MVDVKIQLHFGKHVIVELNYLIVSLEHVLKILQKIDHHQHVQQQVIVILIVELVQELVTVD